jgi:hypothetical protein
MERKIIINNINVRPTLAINEVCLKEGSTFRFGFVGRFCSSYLVNRFKLVSRPYSNICSDITPFSEQWCKDKRAEIYRMGFPAVFEDMSKIKDYNYFATNNLGMDNLSYYSLKDTPGIYMITNKKTKKFYIGMSRNLKSRFYNYMDINRLNRDRASKINRALLKYGFEKFSITILELPNTSDKVTNSFLRKREDFFIFVFKPQYNIKRSLFNRDFEIKNLKGTFKDVVPTIVKNILDKCIDPKDLEHNLIKFLYTTKGSYFFIASTPNKWIRANSYG